MPIWWISCFEFVRYKNTLAKTARRTMWSPNLSPQLFSGKETCEIRMPISWITCFFKTFLGTNIVQDNVIPKLLLSQWHAFMIVLRFAKTRKFHGKVPVILWILTDPLLTKPINFAKMKGKNLLKLIAKLKTIWFPNYFYIVNILLDFWAMYGLEGRHKVME